MKRIPLVRSLLAVILCITMTFCSITVTNCDVQAEEEPQETTTERSGEESEEDSRNISSVTTDSLTDLGFSTETSEIDSDLESGNTPTGNGGFPMRTISELLVNGSGTDTGIFDEEDDGLNLNHENKKENLLKSPSPDSGYSIPESLEYGKSTGYSFVTSESFDPMGTGKDDHMAYICCRRDNSAKVSKFVLYVANADNEYKSYELGTLPFPLLGYYAEAYMPLTAGDFDGDGCEELAVYNYSDSTKEKQWGFETVKEDTDTEEDLTYEVAFDDENLDIRILDVASDLTISRHEFSTANGETAYAEYDLLNMGFSKKEVIGSDYTDRGKYPTISLSTVEQPEDEYDDIIICVNPTREYSKYTQDMASKFVFWIDPGHATDSKTQYYEGSWNYKDDYSMSDSNKEERMAFAGAGAANLDGDTDEYNEVVVAGYRFYDTSSTDENRRFDDGTDADYYLTATYSYDAEKKEYNSDGPATWIYIDDLLYNNSTNMCEQVASIETVQSPLKVAGFAEKGEGYPDSVFINGFVCEYYSADGANGSVTSLPYAPNDLNSAGYSKRNGKFLYTAYAVPMNYIAMDRRDEEDPMRRWLGDVAVGNFDGDVSGTEEVIFTYMRYLDGNKTSASVVGVQKKKPGKLANTSDLYNEKLKIKTKSSLYHHKDIVNSEEYSFTVTDLWWNSEQTSNVVTIADIDWDDDSIVVRPNPNKEPEFYFSDPYVIAVLQSAPYFEELSAEYDFYPSNGSTAISKEEGSSKGVTAGMEISAGLIGGSEASFGLGVNASSVEIEEKLGFNMSVSYAREKEKSYSTTFTGSVGTDMVALTMTPYVRYYYQAWDGTNWQEITLDMPKTPRTTMTSVDTYDRVAQSNGWGTIRGNVLNSTPGNPSTYDSTSAGLEDFDGGKTLMGNSGNNWVGVGTGGTSSVGNITQSISSTTTNEYEFSAGVEMEFSRKVTAGGASSGMYGSLSMTGGGIIGSFDTTSFEGTVDNLPEQAATGYDFLWRFGCWKDNLYYRDSSGRLDSNDIYVLGYLVKDVESLPKPPQDVSVVNMTDSSVTLEWSHPDTIPVSYIVYREEAGGYTPLDIIRADSSSDRQQYVDNTCEAGELYSYVVKSVRYQYGFETVGPNSPEAEGKTLAKDVPKVEILPEITTQAGEDVVFEADVTPVDSNEAVSIQWQKWKDDKYVSINGESDSQYVIKDVTEEMDGNRYRCYVTQYVNGKFKIGYSVYGTLHVTKRESMTTLANPTVEKGTCTSINSTTGLVEGGTEFSFSAIVEEPGTGKRVSGSIEFSFFNTSNGGKYQKKAKLKNGVGSVQFVPSEAGIYSVKAAFRNSDTHMISESEEKTFTVYSNKGKLLVIDSSEELTYGDNLELTTSFIDINGETTTIVPDSYIVTDEDIISSESVSVEIKKNASGKYVFDPVRDSNALYKEHNGLDPTVVRAAGNYVIRAVYKDEDSGETYYATKLVKVNKKDLNVDIADKSVNLKNTTIGSDYLDDVTVSYQSFAKDEEATTVENYKKLISLYTDVSNDKIYVGDHEIKMRYRSASSVSELYNMSEEQYNIVLKQLLANYAVSSNNGTLSVTDEWYTITYKAVGNGNVNARTENRATVVDKDEVLRGTKISFVAAPAAGYSVDEWKADGSTLKDTNSTIMKSASISDDTEVLVSFAAKYQELSWSVNGKGGTVDLDIDGVVSPCSLSSSGTYTLTAHPEEGYGVDSWSVNGVAETNSKGEVVKDAQLTLEGLSKDTVVTVKFAQGKSYEVKATGIAADGKEFGSVSVSPKVSVANKIHEGTKVTFTANTPKNYMISEWRLYTDNTNYTVLQYNNPSYTVDSLDSDMDVRVLFASVVKYKVNYGVNNDELGEITAKSGNTVIHSGQTCDSGVTIRFTVVPKDGYGVSAVVAHYANQQEKVLLPVTSSAAGNTYEVASLQGMINVTANLKKEYSLTVTGGKGSGKYCESDNVTINALAAENKRFKQWTGVDGLVFEKGSSANDESATFTMPSRAVEITAVYEDIPKGTYLVTVQNGTGGNYYEPGAKVTLTANEPKEGEQFKEWTGIEGVTLLSGSSTSSKITFVMPSENVDAVAVYENKPLDSPVLYEVKVNSGSGSGSVAEGGLVTITAASPAEGKQFKEWTGVDNLVFTAGSSVATETATFVMPGNNVEVTATYKDILKPSITKAPATDTPATKVSATDAPATKAPATNEPATKKYITASNILNATVSGIINMNYTGAALQQTFAVILGSTTLVNGTDYTVTYANNTNIGLATVTITGKGNYSGTLTKNFYITAAIGETYTVNSMKYKMTNSSTDGRGTVVVTGTEKKNSSLTSLSIGNSVKIGGIDYKITEIAASAFKGYTTLAKVTIGNNVKKISSKAFSGCTTLAKVTIGTGLVTIERKAFFNNKSLKTIIVKSKKLKSIQTSVIKNIKATAKIKVPSRKVKAYKKLFTSKAGFKSTMKVIKC